MEQAASMLALYPGQDLGVEWLSQGITFHILGRATAVPVEKTVEILRSVPPKSMAQIWEAQGWPRLPRNGVKVQHKYQILVLPPIPLPTCPQVFLLPTLSTLEYLTLAPSPHPPRLMQTYPSLGPAVVWEAGAHLCARNPWRGMKVFPHFCNTPRPVQGTSAVPSSPPYCARKDAFSPQQS